MPISPSWQFALSTPATRFAMGGGKMTRTGGGRRRRKKKAAAPKRRAKRRTSKRASKPARLVKGSRAAKAYMAKIRKKRGRR